MEIRVMVAACDNGWFVQFWAYHPRTLLFNRFVSFDQFPELAKFDI